MVRRGGEEDAQVVGKPDHDAANEGGQQQVAMRKGSAFASTKLSSLAQVSPSRTVPPAQPCPASCRDNGACISA